MPNEDLRHQRMGHASYKQLSIVSKNEPVLGMPKLSKVVNVVCGPCQLGKQMKAQHHATSWVQQEQNLLEERDTTWWW